MQDDLKQSIRERAYQLWVQGGCQDGHADAHWLAAERDVLAASLGEIGRVAPTAFLSSICLSRRCEARISGLGPRQSTECCDTRAAAQAHG